MKRRVFLQRSTAALVAGSSLATQAQASDIVLGQTGILSGALGTAVQTFLAGANLAFDEANQSGGIQGRRIRLESIDDELIPERAVANYGKLLNEHHVVACFGCVGSATTAAGAPLLLSSGTALVGPYAVADSARDRAKGAIYCTRASYGRESDALVEHLATVNITRLAVAVLANPGGRELAGQVAEALKRSNGVLTASVEVAGNGSNAAEAAKKLAQSQPQAVIMYLGGTLPAEFMKAVWAAGSTPAFFGTSIVQADVATRALGGLNRGGLATVQITPYPWNNADPLTLHYRRLAEAKKVPVGYTSFEGYLNAQVMLEALRRAGKDLTRAGVQSAMRGLKMRLAGMDIDFTGGQHNGSRFIELVQMSREGRYLR